MSPLKLLTPPTIPTATISRCLVFPDSVEWRALINGLVANAIDAADWQSFGAITPQEAADRMLQMAQEFFEAEECDMPYKPLISEIKWVAGAILETGWIWCDGTALNKEIYSELYAVVGDRYHIAAPGTHFNIPDLREKFPIGITGLGPAATVNLGTIGGEAAHTLTIPEMPPHDHNQRRVGGSSGAINSFQAPAGDSLVQLNATTGMRGGGLPHNNLPPFVGLMPIIYHGVTE